MAEMYAAFEVKAQHGCLVLRDSESERDVSDWDPTTQAWFVNHGSAIFGVIPGVEGHVRCEIWRGQPDRRLPHEMFSEPFTILGALRVEDPAGVVRVELATMRGARQIQVTVDDINWPLQVQIAVE